MKFKVGQKVRVVKPYSKSAFYDGEIVEIMGISQNAYRGQSCYRAVSCENEDKDWWCLCEDEVEPIPNGNNATPITNGDKIRDMNNRELSDFLRNFDSYDTLAETICKDCVWSDSCTKSCVECLEVWLNSPVEDD